MTRKLTYRKERLRKGMQAGKNNKREDEKGKHAANNLFMGFPPLRAKEVASLFHAVNG